MKTTFALVFVAAVVSAQPPTPQSVKAPNSAQSRESGPKMDLAKMRAFNPPRTETGVPNLEGIWMPRTSGAAYSILPHPGGFFLGTGSDTGIVEGGILPYTAKALEEVKYRREHVELDPTGHCHYEGIPHALYFTFQILQTPNDIAFVHENMHAFRIVHMKGQHPTDELSWMGDARARWEGNTLVVDVANNNDKSVFDMAGHFHSDQLHVVERYTLQDQNTLIWQATLTDPKVWTRPVKMSFPLVRAPKDYQILESGCFEDERDQQHLKNMGLPENHYKDEHEKDTSKK